MKQLEDLKSRRRRLAWQLPFLTLLVAGTVMITCENRATPYQKESGFVFGTVYNITYQCDSSLAPEIRAELMRVDSSLSTFNPQSTISAVNRNENVDVDTLFAHVFTLAKRISADTDGAFDITVAPLVNAWGFGFTTGAAPTIHSLDSLSRFIGSDKVWLEGRKVSKADPRVTLDCSAIAKGYGSDVVAAMLRRRGVSNFMVEIGGEIVAQGVSDRRLPWKIGVAKPNDDSLSQSRELEGVLNITGKAMATSGNYRNYYYKEGKKYAHTIDPRTGYPVQHTLLSATVIADDCATADAYATAFMVMGLDRAKALLARRPELMAYLIYSDSKGQTAVWNSPALADMIDDKTN